MSFPLDYSVLKNDILGTDQKNVVDHADIHNDLADAIMALEQYLGKDSESNFYNKTQIDTITDNFYTKSEIDNQMQAGDEASEITFDNLASGLAATDVQGAIDELASTVTTLDVYSKAETDQKIADLVDSSPAALDTLNELAAALGNDANFATTVSTQIGQKANADGTTVFPSVLLQDGADTYRVEVVSGVLQATLV